MLKNKGKKKNEVQKVRFTSSLSSVFKYIPKVKKIQHLLFTGSNRLFGDLEKKVNVAKTCHTDTKTLLGFHEVVDYW